MNLIDRGVGAPLVLVPGIQGRWEWMAPAVEALARHCRVITFSLADEPTSGGRFDATRGFDCYVEQIAEAMDQAGLERAAVCGVSYGGLIAAAFAARHPGRVASLILVSAVPPSWAPDSRAGFYLRAPRLFSPLFMLGSVRMYHEIAVASATPVKGIVAAGRHGFNVLRHMFSPDRMARRVRLVTATSGLEDAFRGVTVRTLVITGEASLDRVVPVYRTREYLAMWPHAAAATLKRTGHLGLIMRPEAFATIVTDFLQRGSGVM